MSDVQCPHCGKEIHADARKYVVQYKFSHEQSWREIPGAFDDATAAGKTEADMKTIPRMLARVVEVTG